MADAEKSDVDSLLRLVRAHQRQHEDRAYDARAPTAIRRCKTMLTKLRRLLPKLMRPIATLSADRAVPVLQDLCQLLAMLLGGSVCPHSMTLFMESSSGSRAGADNPARSGFASYPTLATMLFYMVSFYCNERLQQAQRDVRGVTLQMVLFLQRNDVYGFIHFFRDTVQLLEDCFLLEECLKDRDMTGVLPDAANISCYLDTAIHVYQDAEGPLGAKSNSTLCGCIPITDADEVYERREQLKKMLPSIQVTSYATVVTLRQSMAILADRLIREHSVMVKNEEAFDRMSQLVGLFVVKNEELMESAKEAYVDGTVSIHEAEEITRSTLRLLHTMLHTSVSAERRFVRLSLVFFKSSNIHENRPRLIKANATILELMDEMYPHLSRFASDTLWPTLESWLSRSMPRLRMDNVDDKNTNYDTVWKSVMSILGAYIGKCNTSSPASIFSSLLEYLNLELAAPEVASSVIDGVQKLLSTKEMLVKVTRAISKALTSQLGRDSLSSSQASRSSRKRKRNQAATDFGDADSIQLRRNHLELHEQLSRWIVDLLSCGNGSESKSVVALSMVLRIIVPLRRYITTFARIEAFPIFRALLQRVQLILSTCAPSLRPITADYLDLWLVLLRYFDDHELENHRDLLGKVIESLESQQVFVHAIKRDKAFVAPDFREYLEFLDLYNVHPKAHDEKTSDNTPEAFYDHLHGSGVLLSAVFRKPLALRAPFLVFFVWSRPVTLKLAGEDSWRNALSWKVAYRAIIQETLPDAAVCSYLAMVPLLVFFAISNSIAPPKKLITCIMETLCEKMRRTNSPVVAVAIVRACGAALCASSYRKPLVDESGIAIMDRSVCRCNKVFAGFQSIPIPLALFGTLFFTNVGGTDENFEVAKVFAVVAVLEHCDVDYNTDATAARYVEQLLSYLGSRSRYIRNATVAAISDHPSVFRGIVDPANENAIGVMERLEALIAVAEESSDDNVIASVVLTAGTIGCECDFDQVNLGGNGVWILLRLVSLWNRFKKANRPICAALAFDQACHIMAHHNISWKQLLAEHPELLYFPLVDELLETQSLNSFLHAFIGDKVDPIAFLRASAPYVLPKYVVHQNERMLHAFVGAYNAAEEERAVTDATADDGIRAASTDVTEILSAYLNNILKDLIIHQVQDVSNKNRLAEWEFLFKFLPENSTVRDVITHSPQRLMNLLAWELGGPQSRMAKRAIREVANCLHEDSRDGETIEQVESMQPGEACMPRHFFLALMADLSNRISGKGSTQSKIRAIKSIDKLTELYGCSSVDSMGTPVNGILDSFVPKVMATLKVGLTERELQEHAIEAWGNFLRMLSVKALESNLSSIIVSLLPCLGYEASSILLEDEILDDSLCWNVESLDRPPSSNSRQSNALADRDAVQNSSMAAAVDILRYLFIEKRTELKSAFPKIPLLPSIPELDQIYVVLYGEDGDPRNRPIREYLAHLSEYVNHLDVSVREMALTQLLRCLVVRGAELKALMQNEGDMYVDSAVSSVIQSVLQLSRTESYEPNKLLCARCIGALGAIDDARVPLSMFYTSSKMQGRTVTKEKLYQKVEYSTKDLACVLIETWLVDELRAAPENTDSLAFAIQELLKFLAELTADPQHSGQSLASTNSLRLSSKSGQDGNASMPEWMRRRFERKDVLQFVEPYWSTNYSISGGRSRRGLTTDDSESDRRLSGNADRSAYSARDDISFYERYGTSYEEWLLMWCRRLIHLSQPPERKIFWACKTALGACPQIARFLLPYLIQNVLRSGRSEVGKELKREFLAVLDDQDRGILMDDVFMTNADAENSSESLTIAGEKAVTDYFRRHDQCSQTIFSTIDELNEWLWASEKKRLTLSSSAASRQASAPSGRLDIPSELDDHEKDYLDEFLKEIPSRSLSNAAFKVKAFARAIQYFEIYLRQLEYSPPTDTRDIVDITTPVHLSLIAKNAFYLQQLYKSVDEPDTLIGLATLRRLNAASQHCDNDIDTQMDKPDEGLTLTNLMHEIVDHEQLAQWEDALACYEQAIQEIRTVKTSFSDQLPQSQHPTQIPEHDSNGNASNGPNARKSELYSGMIGCLIQLGRLESALQHINGIAALEPNFMATLYPYALECSWRLSRWDLLADLLSTEEKNPLLLSSSNSSDGSGTMLKGADVSQMMLVRVLYSLHCGLQDEFQRNLKIARLEVMGPLAAASAESYQRAYPYLQKLHFLHEAEQGFIFLKRAKGADTLDQRSLLWRAQSPWGARYDLLATPLKYRDPILALRRVLLHEADLRSEVSENWLVYAKLTRKEGFIRTATSAVMHAEALKHQYASLEKAKLLVSQDRMYEALQILEPVDIDASTLDFDVDDPHFCAKTLLLATNWMQESGQRQGKKVIERYQAVIHFDPKWEKGYFFLAKYYEYLLSVSHPEAMSGSIGGGEDAAALLVDSVFHSHLMNLMKNYVQALTHGTKFLFQSLPRLLTLWFEYGEVLNTSLPKGNKVNKALRQVQIGVSQSTNEHQVFNDITAIMNDATSSLPAYEWLVCFPQVTSRICHPNSVVVDGVKKIMIRVLVGYPTQAMWPLLGLSRSLNPQRLKCAREIIANTQQQFVAKGLKEIADSFSEGMRMAEELIDLAGYDPGNNLRKIHIRITRIRTKILVPIQAALTTILPTSGLAPRDEEHVAFSPNAQVYIKAFSDKADVMLTKEKPKRIEVMGSDGLMYPFLCKREKTGDLRKDARMMEFNTMINKLLQKDQEGRKRKLRLRTYAVVCLNEESGLMEWVRHTKAMRQLIGQIHKTERGYVYPVRLNSDVKEKYLSMQKRYANDPPMMARYYKKRILSNKSFTPRFHQWFYNNFADPTAWFEARLVFSRSAAVWSMVGHIIGLGDRHGENILIDCTNGECVHVDFDCLFDKGLKLAKPEIVPFRLTPNIIDAFGITGYEGVFRRVSEVTMHLLRENKETLRSVLESFIHDPLVEWGRRGKTTQSRDTAGKSAAELTSERSKEETRLVLKSIDDRLRGIYNLGDAIRPLVSQSHRNILPENETLPLSVQGQVDKLIHEATSLENLAQMYIGWMPFL